MYVEIFEFKTEPRHALFIQHPYDTVNVNTWLTGPANTTTANRVQRKKGEGGGRF
jgi:hypothetical protein